MKISELNIDVFAEILQDFIDTNQLKPPSIELRRVAAFIQQDYPTLSKKEYEDIESFFRKGMSETKERTFSSPFFGRLVSEWRKSNVTNNIVDNNRFSDENKNILGLAFQGKTAEEIADMYNENWIDQLKGLAKVLENQSGNICPPLCEAWHANLMKWGYYNEKTYPDSDIFDLVKQYRRANAQFKMSVSKNKADYKVKMKYGSIIDEYAFGACLCFMRDRLLGNDYSVPGELKAKHLQQAKDKLNART